MLLVYWFNASVLLTHWPYWLIYTAPLPPILLLCRVHYRAHGTIDITITNIHTHCANLWPAVLQADSIMLIQSTNSDFIINSTLLVEHSYLLDITKVRVSKSIHDQPINTAPYSLYYNWRPTKFIKSTHLKWHIIFDSTLSTSTFREIFYLQRHTSLQSIGIPRMAQINEVACFERVAYVALQNEIVNNRQVHKFPSEVKTKYLRQKHQRHWQFVCVKLNGS